jgi:hypothetical protein
MADADTLQSVTTPAVLATRRPIVYLAGSPEYLVWTESVSTLVASELGTGKEFRYSFGSDAIMHPFQFPTLAGHFLIWFTGYSNTILDLKTGGAIDINLPGAVAGVNGQIVIAQIAAGQKGAITDTTVTSFDPSLMSKLPPCHH